MIWHWGPRHETKTLTFYTGLSASGGSRWAGSIVVSSLYLASSSHVSTNWWYLSRLCFCGDSGAWLEVQFWEGGRDFSHNDWVFLRISCPLTLADLPLALPIKTSHFTDKTIFLLMKILWSWKYKQDKKVISSRQVLYVTVPGGKP